MNDVVHFVTRHGYSILFAAVFARQIGLPVPANLFVLAAGAVAATGKLEFVATLWLSVTACLIADWVWYEAGRRRGERVLHFLHSFTRDPEAHDRRAKATFSKYGPPMLVIAKFIPGLDAVAPPLAGTSQTSRLRFLVFELIGASLWSCTYAGLGFVFSHDLNRAALYIARAGRSLIVIALVAVCILGARKLARYMRQHSSAN